MSSTLSTWNPTAGLIIPVARSAEPTPLEETEAKGRVKPEQISFRQVCCRCIRASAIHNKRAVAEIRQRQERTQSRSTSRKTG